MEYPNTKTYGQIFKEEATQTLDELLGVIRNLRLEHTMYLNDGRKTYFDQGLKP